MRDVRHLIAGLLAFVMVLTSGAMAVARGQVYDAAGAVIICTSHGFTIAWVDADGNPVDAPHLCPDCVLALVAPTAPASAELETRLVASEYAFPVVGAEALDPNTSGIHARAPPVGSEFQI